MGIPLSWAMLFYIHKMGLEHVCPYMKRSSKTTSYPVFSWNLKKIFAQMTRLKKNSFSNAKHFRKIASQMSKIIAQISTPVQIQWVFKIKMASQISKNASQMTTVSEKSLLKCYVFPSFSLKWHVVFSKYMI